MSILEVIKYPNKILKTKAEEITEITEDLTTLAMNMIEAMYKDNGIGLAANQVGILKRIIVIDLQENNELNPMVLINPKIIWKSEEIAERDEGCLSLPEVSSIVKRPAEVEVSYLDLDGKEETIKAIGLLATCLQHEIDHLDGILFIDRISKLKREMVIKKFKKLQAEEE